MTLQAFFTWFTQGSLVLVSILTLIQYARWRDRASLDIVYVFGSLAFLLVFEQALSLAKLQIGWLQPLRLTILLAHPYLLLRVVGNFQPISRGVRRAAAMAFVFSLAVVWVNFYLLIHPDTLPMLSLFHKPAAAAIAFLYFAVLLGYVALAFRRRAQSAGGVTHWRMLHASWGIVSIGLVFVLAILINLSEPARATGSAFIPLLALAAAMNYYFAFAPPAWLRRVWQSSALYGFLAETSSVPALLRTRHDVLDRVCTFVAAAVGARGAAVALEDPQSHELIVAVSHWDSLKPGSAVPEGRLLEAWRDGRSVFIKDYEPAGSPTALGAYGVVIPSTVAPHGVLIAVLPKGALFVGDDIALLRICGRETAVQLDNAALAERQQQLIGELEQKSTQLAAVNKELEAFSYSVSHDLRAPLRHISGFTDLLGKAEGSNLDPQKKRYLDLIGDSAVKMGELIDSLLVFSRMGRAEMLRSRVNLNSLVAAAQRDAVAADPARQVNWIIHPLPEVPGDPTMLQLVFTNLLSNAFKYSRTRPDATIEVGVAEEKPGEIVLFVKDNGVGFDMAYAGRLFGVFQRLHRADEFEGTGIGLANVQRIVTRHGGRVWAEAELGKGATFFVALPTERLG